MITEPASLESSSISMVGRNAQIGSRLTREDVSDTLEELPTSSITAREFFPLAWTESRI
jgi:hypothetical protein